MSDSGSFLSFTNNAFGLVFTYKPDHINYKLRTAGAATVKYLINVFFILVLCMSGSHLFAFGDMSAGEVRTLITGNTVEGERRQGVKGGQGPPGMVDTYAEKFTMYFAEDGTVKRKIDEVHKKGKWRVTESGKLCLKWGGKKEKCASVYKDGKAYKRVTKKSSGRVLWEIKFIEFTPGNELNL